MEIYYQGEGKFLLKLKQIKVEVGQEIKVSPETGEPYVISGPGEYEIKGVSVTGWQAGEKEVIYLIEMDELVIGYFVNNGAKLTEKNWDHLEGMDVLLVGFEDDGSLVKKIDPSVAVVMKAMDESTARREKKLVLKKAELPEETAVFVLDKI
ncbi:MAG: MBL fold metallo-hydrolase [Patescibacteria group bacterium]